MAYSLAWGSNHPGHLIYLVDLSWSMASDNKIDDVINVIENVSDYLVGMCEDFGNLKDRFSIHIIGYGDDVKTLFKGSVLELDRKLEETMGKGKPIFDKAKEAKPYGLTYTAKAFRAALDDIKQWINQQNSLNIPIPVPVVIHITDGHPEEIGKSEAESMKDALGIANEIKNIKVPDGNALIFNIHIDGVKTCDAVRFPATPPSDERRRFLYEASSTMPSIFVTRAAKFGAGEGCRFMVAHESDKKMLARLIAFGSSVSSVGSNASDLKDYTG